MRLKNKSYDILGFGGLFYLIAIIIFLISRSLILLFNFIYIGTAIVFGFYLYYSLPNKKKYISRNFTKLAVGMYMIFIVAFYWQENIQIESFIFNVLSIIGGNIGVFATASILHYLIAKTVGVTIIGRNWCGWACWYPAIFDLFPYKQSKGRIKKLSILPYINLIITLLVAIYVFYNKNYYSFYKNNIVSCIFASITIYYSIGLSFTVIFKDNRAMCKYFCPVAIIQKIFMPLSLFYVQVDSDKCIDCKQCERNCIMDVEITKYVQLNKNVNSKECIQCRKCVEVCPKGAIHIKFNSKRGKTKEYINYKK